MSLPIEIRNALSEAKPLRQPEAPDDVYNKLPTLKPFDFPDNVLLRDLENYQSEYTHRLKAELIKAGFTKGQRAGLSRTLGTMTRINNHEVTIGDIRSLTLEELLKLQLSFQYGHPTADSLRRVKKLCGSYEGKPETDLRERIIF